jgi:nucleolar protein 15
MTDELSSVIYIGHLPEDFEEPQMRTFFSQFGTIKNLQLARSPRTGNSKHYGWIEFETSAIASVVAKAMDHYLLFKNFLVCSVLPKARVHPMLFKNGRQTMKKPKSIAPMSKKEVALKLARKEQYLRTTLAAKGIEYEWPSFVEQFAALGITIPEQGPEQPIEEEQE